MKKLLLAVTVIMGVAASAKADSLVSQLYGGFVGRAKFAIESTTKGTVQPEFLVNYVEIGKLGGDHIAAIDAGALGTVLPDSGHFDSVDWTAGGKLHLAPFIKQFVHLPAGWEFLDNTEIDARASYNLTQHAPFYGLVMAYPFK